MSTQLLGSVDPAVAESVDYNVPRFSITFGDSNIEVMEPTAFVRTRSGYVFVASN